MHDRLVTPQEAGMRLDRFLAAAEEVGTRARAERLIEAGEVLVDGGRRPKSFRLVEGATVTFPEPEPATLDLEPVDIDVPVLYEDDWLMVVDKPAGLLVHPVPGHRGPTLVHALLGRVGGGEAARPGIVHRLDRETSGLLVVARDDRTLGRLQGMLRRRAISRTYAALVRGRPASRSGTIEAPIGRDRRDPTRVSLDTDNPRDAVTHFSVVELLPRHTLLDVNLDTGRTHQIRVHLEAIGIPVAGDPVYGHGAELGIERQFLHARRLAFAHPQTGDGIEVESPLREDLESALRQAREAPRPG
jgi:23S rRNA pseudouridine1911/1915/1917 synthase